MANVGISVLTLSCMLTCFRDIELPYQTFDPQLNKPKPSSWKGKAKVDIPLQEAFSPSYQKRFFAKVLRHFGFIFDEDEINLHSNFTWRALLEVVLNAHIGPSSDVESFTRNNFLGNAHIFGNMVARLMIPVCLSIPNVAWLIMLVSLGFG